MEQDNQAFNAAKIAPDERVLALSWKIATEPKLYRKLSPNPYSADAHRILSERFPQASAPDTIKAVILAEPEGKYDRKFKRLKTAAQTEELRKQTDITTERNKLLSEYCEKHRQELHLLPREFLYESLSTVAFETNDLKKIEQNYAQHQRLELKLAIVTFIESLPQPALSYPKKSQVPIWQLFLPVFAGLVLLLAYYAIGQLHTTQSVVIGTQQETQWFPVRLIIPNIGVSAPVEAVGVAPDGAMGVPSNIVDVGWFSFGPHPGQRGSSVIAGHFDGEDGSAGVFSNLDQLKKGDKVYVTDGAGKTTSFIVRETRSYDPGHADDVFNQTDGAHLNLITCDGVWDRVKKSYSKRLVVFADIMR